MNRHALVIQHALPIVAKVIGRKLDVQVQIGGDQAWTDGEVIHIPALPLDDPDIETLAFGYLEHEAGHVRYSEDVSELIQSPLHQEIMEVFEDIRIERLIGAEYPGFASTLKRLVKKLVDTEGVFEVPDADTTPALCLQRYLLYRLRSQVLQQSALDPVAAATEVHFRKIMPEGVATRIGAAIGRVPAVKSSSDAAELALEVIRIIKDEKQSIEDQHLSAESQQAEKPAEASSQAAAETLQQLLEAEADEFDKGLGEQVGEALSDAASDCKRQGRNRTAGMGQASEPLAVRGDSGIVLSEVRQSTTALSTRLKAFLEASRHVKCAHSSHGLQLNDRRLVKAVCGDPRIYRKKTKQRQVNTVVQLLLDRSGSMRGASMDIARRAALSVASCLDDISGIRIAAAAFPGHKHEVEPLTLMHESVKATATRYDRVNADGGTPLLPAMLWAVDQLLMQQEPRKILLVITDGAPSQKDACCETIKRCTAGGIEILGIGIDVPSVKNLFPMSECITDIGDLAQAMFSLLQQTLLKQPVV